MSLIGGLVFLGCGDDGDADSPDARMSPDAAASIDAAPGNPDAAPGNPDAAVGAPDGAVAFDATPPGPDATPPDAALPDGGVLVPPPVGLWGSEAFAPSLHSFDPATGAVLATLTLTDADAAVTFTGTNGMCWDPVAGVMRIVVKDDIGFASRHLGTVDMSTGEVTIAGALADSVASIACADDGTLYGLTGQNNQNQTTTPNTLYTLDTATAAMTMVATLADSPANNTDGESLAYDEGGMLYRMSGNGDPKYFGSVTTTGTEAAITLSATPDGEVTAVSPGVAGTLFFTTRGDQFASLAIDGTVTPITTLQTPVNQIADYIKGLVFQAAP